jgi:hypothetical protein
VSFELRALSFELRALTWLHISSLCSCSYQGSASQFAEKRSRPLCFERARLQPSRKCRKTRAASAAVAARAASCHFRLQIEGGRGRPPLHFPAYSAVPAPPYFCSHFNSSRTLIFPCHGFLSSGCPSPGKISNVLGMPRECRAWSSR